MLWVWRRRVSPRRRWQPSAERWFVLVSGQIVFGGILTALVNHLQLPSLKWNNIPFPLLSICLPLSLNLPLVFTPAHSFIVSRFSRLWSVWADGFFPILSVRVPAFAVDCEAPRSLTDGESVTGSVTGPSGSRWPQDQHWWSDKWLNEPRLASYKFQSVRFVTQNTTFTKNHNIVYSS